MLFRSHFILGHRYKKSITCLMNIKQREDERLRSYITCFNKEALSIDEANDKILVAAFTNRLRKGKFLFSLYKNDLKTMSDVLYKATKYMNAEDTLLACKDKPRKRERQEDTLQDRGCKATRTGEQRDDRYIIVVYAICPRKSIKQLKFFFTIVDMSHMTDC